MAQDDNREVPDEGVETSLGSGDGERVDVAGPGSTSSTGGAKKLTKGELTARAEKIKQKNRADKFAARARRAPAVGLVRMVSTVAAVAVVIGVGGWMLGTGSGHEDNVNANNDRIAELNGELNEVSNEQANVPEPEVLSQSITEANERARGLLDIQNRMIDRGLNNDEPNLVAYAELVEDSRGFMTQSSLSGGDFLPHGRWFMAHEVRDVPGRDGKREWAPLSQERWEWHLRPATDVADDGEVPVIWEARLKGGERDGALLVTVRGDYDPGRSLFHGFTKVHTKLGADFRGATTAEAGTGTGADLEGQENQDDDVTPAPEDSDVLRDAMEALEDARREGGSQGQGEGE